MVVMIAGNGSRMAFRGSVAMPVNVGLTVMIVHVNVVGVGGSAAYGGTQQRFADSARQHDPGHSAKNARRWVHLDSVYRPIRSGSNGSWKSYRRCYVGATVR